MLWIDTAETETKRIRMRAKVNTRNLPSTLDGASDGTKQSSSRSEVPEAVVAHSIPHVLHRDPQDVRTILSLTWMGIFFALLLLASVGLNVFQYIRRPDRIIIDRSSGQVLMINDREYGEIGAVSVGPDRPEAKEKEYISNQFIKAVYGIDPATRAKDMERAIRMMVPESAGKFAAWLKQTGVLDKQRTESWQVVWIPQQAEIDRTDPYMVRILGRQQITKVVANAAKQEARQLSFTLKLVVDKQGRAEHNLMSGFLVAWFDEKEVVPDGKMPDSP